MTGRGVDQIQRHPGGPRLHEPYVDDAREYVALAERASGAVPRSAPPAYLWGDGLDAIDRWALDARIVNLETSVTRSDDYWTGKGINYRMHPDNVGCLTAARIDVCVLANNHILDYGYAGLAETLGTLTAAGLRTAGAGLDLAGARQPAIVDLPEGGRVVVLAFAHESSGVPPAWAADPDRSGVDLLGDLSDATAAAIGDRARRVRQPGDLVVASIHWGGNWGYDVPARHRRFAHRLIDAGVDVVHGHSSHHPRPMELYEGKLVLYGCGDLIDDYEGISGYEEYRGDLRLMYFPALERATGRLAGMRMAPMRMRKLRLERAAPPDADWLRLTLDRVCRPFDVTFDQAGDGSLVLHSPALPAPA